MDKLYTDMGWGCRVVKLDTHSKILVYKSTLTIIYYRELLHLKFYVNRMLNECSVDILTDLMY